MHKLVMIMVFGLQIISLCASPKEEIKKIIERRWQAYSYYGLSDNLEREIEKIGIATMNPTERMTLLKELYDLSAEQVKARSEEYDGFMLQTFYVGSFLGSIAIGLKFLPKVLRPERPVDFFKAGIDRVIMGGSILAFCYFGYKGMQSSEKLGEYRFAQWREAYFKHLVEKYARSGE